jgi:hypothetical protein
MVRQTKETVLRNSEPGCSENLQNRGCTSQKRACSRLRTPCRSSVYHWPTALRLPCPPSSRSGCSRMSGPRGGAGFEDRYLRFPGRGAGFPRRALQGFGAPRRRLRRGQVVSRRVGAPGRPVALRNIVLSLARRGRGGGNGAGCRAINLPPHVRCVTHALRMRYAMRYAMRYGVPVRRACYGKNGKLMALILRPRF